MNILNKTLKQTLSQLPDSLPHTARFAIARILVEEQGKSNRSSDRGGLTNFGISKRWYPRLDIANLSIMQAASIYYLDYWCFNRCHKLPPELALTVFDCAVNQGGVFARLTLQKLLKVKQDGVIGSKTLAAAHAQCNLIFLTQYTRERCRRYNNIAQADTTQVANIEGWNDRALDILVECQLISLFGVGE